MLTLVRDGACVAIAAMEYVTKGTRLDGSVQPLSQHPFWRVQGSRQARRCTIPLYTLHPIKRLGTPEEIAEMIVWLCPNVASFVTGSAMLVAGGCVVQ